MTTLNRGVSLVGLTGNQTAALSAAFGYMEYDDFAHGHHPDVVEWLERNGYDLNITEVKLPTYKKFSTIARVSVSDASPFTESMILDLWDKTQRKETQPRFPLEWTLRMRGEG